MPTQVILDEGGKPKHHPAQGLRSAGRAVVDLDVVSGRLDLRDDAVAVSRPIAEQRGWKVGDRIPLWLADGTRKELTVIAVYGNWRGFGELVLPAGLVVEHDPRGLVGALHLTGPDTLGRTIHADRPGLTVVSDTASKPGDASKQQGAWELMVLISLGFTAIAVVNTFAVSTGARRREFTGLRLAGATGPQLHRLLARETVITVAVALMIGCLITGIVVGAFSVGQDGRWRLFAEPLRYFGLLGGVAALGIVAGAVPAHLVIRRRSLPGL
ncbi:FtsX-like permease family protein [Kribbella sp. NPDC051586]|uniref:FtsX-like permease family protein n=1 Tax=Kribbella sp. NPDC051586 TaxID=3364118 RepID=UPI0037906606